LNSQSGQARGRNTRMERGTKYTRNCPLLPYGKKRILEAVMTRSVSS
jgi:hypothetical protein